MMDSQPDPKAAPSLADMTAEQVKHLVDGGGGRVMPIPDPFEPTEEQRQLNGLAYLREQFPSDRIEKLPKPMWKNAWEGKKASSCPTCNGYHVLEHCIHLDYVGHANVTDRLLEVDPFWDWEPLALTDAGTPLFSDGGLWIKLTVCGVTRLGYGDGKSVKEVIGDGIRNAAMRFGVGLDLWAKIDLHAERNPGDGTTSRQRDDAGQAVHGQRSTGRGQTGGRQDQPAVAPNPSPEVQDALESLGAVCDDCGYDRRTMAGWYIKWATKQGLVNPDIYTAKPENIKLFAAELIAQSSGEPSRAGEAPGGEADADIRGADSGPAVAGAAEAEQSADAAAGAEAGVAGGTTQPDGGPNGEGLGMDEAQSNLF